MPVRNSILEIERPLDTGPGERQIRAGHLSGFPVLAQRCGGDPRRLLERYGIDPRNVADPDQYIDCGALVRLLDGCGILFGEPLFGLRLAELQGPDVFGSAAALCRAAPTVRKGLHALIDYRSAAHSRQGEFVLVANGKVAELRWRGVSEPATARQADYQFLLLMIKVLRMLAGADFRPTCASLNFDVPQVSLSGLMNSVGCGVSCRQQHNAITFPAAVLDWSVASANRLTYRLLENHLKTMRTAPDADLVVRVEAYIRGAMPSGNCTIVRCAQKLGLTVRMLQIQLKKQNLSFSDLLEEQRVELAKMELRSGVSSMQEIAGMLGYSEQAAFGRAFKRWTGTSPCAFREMFAVVRAPARHMPAMRGWRLGTSANDHQLQNVRGLRPMFDGNTLRK